MAFLKLTSKDQYGNREVRFIYVSGIIGLCKTEQELIDVTIDTEEGSLKFCSTVDRNRTAELPLSRVKDVRDFMFTKTYYADKSVIGRAIVGSWLGGPNAPVIGAISALQGKVKKTDYRRRISIFYDDTEGREKQILLEICGASIGWRKFVKELPKDENSVYAPKEKPESTHIKL